MSETDIRKYLKEYPNEFKQSELDAAIRGAKQGWEDIGRRQSDGTCIGNSRAWFYNMANRYQWSDKQEIKQQTNGVVQVNVVKYNSKKPPQHNVDGVAT